jgi:hypothetical protein
MICTDAMPEGFSFVPSRRVRALNTGMNSEKGRKMSCHSPSLVSKLLQAAKVGGSVLYTPLCWCLWVAILMLMLHVAVR